MDTRRYLDGEDFALQDFCKDIFVVVVSVDGYPACAW
jgi:hypothetical protein